MDLYINMNVKLRQGGRNAVKMAMEDFEEKLEQLSEQLDCGGMYDFVQTICYKIPSIKKDMKVNVNIENFEYSYRMTTTGVPYLFVEASSDYSPWMVFMIYWDGSKFRAYIPTYGNPWNTNTKEMIGENPEEDYEFILKQLGRTIDDYGDDDDDYDPEDALYEFIQDIYFNEAACIKDFEARLTVK